MHRASFVIAIATLLGNACAVETAAAQSATIPSRLIPRVTAAGAFDARNNGRGDPEMYLGIASLEWGTSASGLALRLDGLYARRDRISHVDSPCDDCDRLGNGASYYSSKVTGAGALIGATYTLLRHRPFRPYVLGGVGVVRTHDRFVAGVMPPPCTSICLAVARRAPTVDRNERPMSAAANAGVGAVYSWDWFSVLAEARYLAVGYANTRGLDGAVPVSLGVRVGRH
jgi:hypothetical protein